tara:strand:+ start:530 stop:724 length:195 start_codon:yes stop_codon:yes gene_type:complete
MKKTITVIFAGFAFFLQSAIAQKINTESSIKPVSFIMAFSGEIGGDEVSEVFFTNGESQSVKAG